MELIIGNTLDLGMSEEDYERYFKEHPDILERLDKETDRLLAEWESKRKEEGNEKETIDIS